MAHEPRRDAHYVTPEEYDRLELEHGIKYEWFSGEVFPRADVGPDENILAANALGQLGNRLRGQPCDARGSSQRIGIPAYDAVVYADGVIACPPHEYDEKSIPALLNPRAIIEVLSPSTANYDRNGKFAMYQKISSLQHYVLIASDYKTIEHFERSERGWIYNVARSDDVCIELSDLNCRLCVRETYKRLDLPSTTIELGREEY